MLDPVLGLTVTTTVALLIAGGALEPSYFVTDAKQSLDFIWNNKKYTNINLQTNE